MATVSLGKVAFTWKGAYAAGTTYNLQDVAYLNGDSWICLADGTIGISPGTNAAKWVLFAQGARSVATTAGDIIYHNGSSLVRLAAGTAGQVLTINSSGLPIWTTPDIRSGTKVLKLPENAKSNSATLNKYGVVMTDNSVRLWGAQTNYDLGDGTNNNRNYSMRPGFPPDYPGTSKLYMTYNAGGWTIDTAGKLWAWGLNGTTTSVAGSGDAVAKGVPYCSSLNSSNSIYGKTVTQLALQGGPANYNTPVVLCSDGTVHASGYNGYGQCGDSTTTNRTTFAQCLGLTNISYVAGGAERYGHFLALKSDGTVWAWGYNSNGQCGDNTVVNVTTPKQVTLGSLAGKTIVKIYAGYLTSFAIDSTGALHAWGINAYGQLGNGNTTQQLVPVQVMTGVTDVYLNAYDYQLTLIRRTDKSIWVSGAGNYSANLVVAATATSTFAQVPLPSTAAKAIVGGTGSYNFCAVLLESGIVKVWGYNVQGQLGVGDNVTRTTVDTALTGNRLVVDIGNAGSANLAGIVYLMDDGSVLVSGAAYVVPEEDAQASYVPYPLMV